jgi:hypothetical protein
VSWVLLGTQEAAQNSLTFGRIQHYLPMHFETESNRVYAETDKPEKLASHTGETQGVLKEVRGVNGLYGNQIIES